MNINLLTTTPISGNFEEVHFGENFNDTLWADFEISEDNHWLGCFSKSSVKGLDKVLYNTEEKTCCIIAGGKGYFIDFETKKIIFETEEHPLIESIVQSSNPSYYFLGSFYNIYVLNNKGLVKVIEPDFVVDGIYLESQSENKIIGKIATAENQYERELEISVDIEKLEFDQLVYKISKKSIWKKMFEKFGSYGFLVRYLR